MLTSKAVINLHGCLILNSKLPTNPRFCGWERRKFGGKLEVRGGYIKREMETPGAYELIDEENGEKVILWGGIDDGDEGSSVPSKDVISWSPTEKMKERGAHKGGTKGVDLPTVVQNGGTSIRSTRRMASGFGRLKAQKINNLVKKTLKQKQELHAQKFNVLDIEGTEDYHHQYDELDIEDTDDEDEDDQFGTSDSERKVTRQKEPAISKSGIDQLLEKQAIKSLKSNEKSPGRASNNSASTLKGWGNREQKQRTTNESRDPKSNWKQSASGDFFSRRTFKELDCSDDIIESLRMQHFVRPSNIQAMAFGPAKDGKSCIIADQSGSGKTLAYLAPIIQRLRCEELEGRGKSLPRSPRAIILVPTAELASQVLKNCRSLSKYGVPFRSMVTTGGFRQKTQLENLEEGVDVLIATPGRFMYLIKEGFLELSNLRSAVLDEVDVLFKDEDFESVLQTLMTSSPVTTQYLFVTATLPVDIYNKLIEVFPDCEVIMGPGLHRTSSGLEEVLVDCSGEEGAERNPETAFLNKKSALLKITEESPVPKTIIFCNKIETCRKVENVLRRLDRKENRTRVLPFHAALDLETRLANMKEFLDSQSRERSVFLICTDRVSRGIDFIGVDHIVLFDFPRDPSEYIRRIGRTARGAGGKGRAFVFVVGKQVSLARRIMERNQKGHPLHEVPSSYEVFG